MSNSGFVTHRLGRVIVQTAFLLVVALALNVVPAGAVGVSGEERLPLEPATERTSANGLLRALVTEVPDRFTPSSILHVAGLRGGVGELSLAEMVARVDELYEEPTLIEPSEEEQAALWAVLIRGGLLRDTDVLRVMATDGVTVSVLSAGGSNEHNGYVQAIIGQLGDLPASARVLTTAWTRNAFQDIFRFETTIDGRVVQRETVDLSASSGDPTCIDNPADVITCTSLGIGLGILGLFACGILIGCGLLFVVAATALTLWCNSTVREDCPLRQVSAIAPSDCNQEGCSLSLLVEWDNGGGLLGVPSSSVDGIRIEFNLLGSSYHRVLTAAAQYVRDLPPGITSPHANKAEEWTVEQDFDHDAECRSNVVVPVAVVRWSSSEGRFTTTHALPAFSKIPDPLDPSCPLDLRQGCQGSAVAWAPPGTSDALSWAVGVDCYNVMDGILVYGTLFLLNEDGIRTSYVPPASRDSWCESTTSCWGGYSDMDLEPGCYDVHLSGYAYIEEDPVTGQWEDYFLWIDSAPVCI